MKNRFGWDSPEKETSENYINKCISFVKNDELFNNFKRDKDFQKILEGNELVVGQVALASIDNKNKRGMVVDNLYQFKENEKIGNPQLCFFSGIGEVAPSTLRYVNTYLEIKELLGSDLPYRIVEIGGGYGGLCKILSSVFNFKEYVLIDLPEVIALCKKYISHFHELEGRVKFFSVADIQSINLPDIDLVIADSSLAECSSETQMLYTKLILNKSKYIYMIYNTLHDPKGPSNFKKILKSLKNYYGKVE